jgi:argininosuccinate lyase
MTYEGCSDCQTQKKALWKAVNNALLVIEMFEVVVSCARQVLGVGLAAKEVYDLAGAIDDYEKALEKWKESHENVSELPEVRCKC